MHEALVRAALAAALVTTGCGANGSASLPADQALPTATARPQAPRINWDGPYKEMVSTTLDRAQQDGQLPFEFTPPRFTVEPYRVDVTSPAFASRLGSLVLIHYRLGAGDGMPLDGRVLVTESATDYTERYFAEVLADPPGRPQDFQSVTVKGVPGVLNVSPDGLTSRVQLIRPGVMLDITGPALPSSVAMQLAALL